MDNRRIRFYFLFVSLVLGLLLSTSFLLSRKLTIIVPHVTIPDPRELIPEKITLSGEFFNKKNGSPAAQVDLKLYVGETVLASGETDAQGHFDFSIFIRRFNIKIYKELRKGKFRITLSLWKQKIADYQHNSATNIFPSFNELINRSRQNGGFLFDKNKYEFEKYGYVPDTFGPNAILVAQSTGNFDTTRQSRNTWKKYIGRYGINMLDPTYHLEVQAYKGLGLAGTSFKDWILCFPKSPKEIIRKGTFATTYADISIKCYKPEKKPQFNDWVVKVQGDTGNAGQLNPQYVKRYFAVYGIPGKYANVSFTIAYNKSSVPAYYEEEYLGEQNFGERRVPRKIPVFTYKAYFRTAIESLKSTMGYVFIDSQLVGGDLSTYKDYNICLKAIKNDNENDFEVFIKYGKSWFVSVKANRNATINGGSNVFMKPGSYRFELYKKRKYGCVVDHGFFPVKTLPSFKVLKGKKSWTPTLMFTNADFVSKEISYSYKNIPDGFEDITSAKLVTVGNNLGIKLIDEVNIRIKGLLFDAANKKVKIRFSNLSLHEKIGRSSNPIIQKYRLKSKTGLFSEEFRVSFSYNSSTEKYEVAGVSNIKILGNHNLVKIKISIDSSQSLKYQGVCIKATKAACTSTSYEYVAAAGFDLNETLQSAKSTLGGKPIAWAIVKVKKGSVIYNGYARGVAVPSVLTNKGVDSITIAVKPVGADVDFEPPTVFKVDDNHIAIRPTKPAEFEQIKVDKAKVPSKGKFTCRASASPNAPLSGSLPSSIFQVNGQSKIDLVVNGCFKVDSTVYDNVVYIHYSPSTSSNEYTALTLQDGLLITGERTFIFKCNWTGCEPHNVTSINDIIWIKNTIADRMSVLTRAIIFNDKQKLTNSGGFTYAETNQIANTSKHQFTDFDGVRFIADRADEGKTIMRVRSNTKLTNGNFVGGEIPFVKGARLPVKLNFGGHTGSPNSMTSEYIRGNSWTGANKFHGGFDVGWSGTVKPKINSICAGKVERFKDEFATGSGRYLSSDGGGYGNQLYIICNKKLKFKNKKNLPIKIIYAHLEKESIKLFNASIGKVVNLGNYLAKANHTGSSTKDHLHVGAKYKDGTWKKVPLNCIDWDAGEIKVTCYNYTTSTERRVTVVTEDTF